MKRFDDTKYYLKMIGRRGQLFANLIHTTNKLKFEAIQYILMAHLYLRANPYQATLTATVSLLAATAASILISILERVIYYRKSDDVKR